MSILRAAHLPPTLVVTLVTTGLAVGVGMAVGRLVVLVVAAALGQLSVGWSNDWLDARRGSDAGRADKPVATGQVGVVAVRRAALFALVGAVVASAFLGPVAGGLHVAAVAVAWAYNLGLKATPWSLLCYLLSFAALPAVVTVAAGLGAPAWWATLAATCFGGGVHLANALPDIEMDRVHGVLGMPQRLGPAGSLAGSVLFLAVGAGAALLGPAVGRGTGVSAQTVVGLVGIGLLLVAVVALAGVDRREAAFRTTMLVGLAVVGLLVAQGGQIAG